MNSCRFLQPILTADCHECIKWRRKGKENWAAQSPGCKDSCWECREQRSENRQQVKGTLLMVMMMFSAPKTTSCENLLSNHQSESRSLVKASSLRFVILTSSLTTESKKEKKSRRKEDERIKVCQMLHKNFLQELRIRALVKEFSWQFSFREQVSLSLSLFSVTKKRQPYSISPVVCGSSSWLVEHTVFSANQKISLREMSQKEICYSWIEEMQDFRVENDSTDTTSSLTRAPSFIKYTCFVCDICNRAKRSIWVAMPWSLFHTDKDSSTHDKGIEKIFTETTKGGSLDHFPGHLQWQQLNPDVT